QCLHVVPGQRLPRPRAAGGAEAALRAVRQVEDIGAQALEHVLDRLLRALAHGDHRDHRADAEHDAEHGQRCAHLVAPQRPHRELERGEDVHAATSALTGVCVLSSMIRPSRKVTTRDAYAAMSDSWVTRMMVLPCVTRPCRIAITSYDVLLSRLPVGSSAMMIAAAPTSARAIATRCCWPPDSWLEWWSARSARPTCSSACSARLWRSRPGTPWYISGISTFSSALVRDRRLKLWNTKPIIRPRTSASWVRVSRA